MSKRVFFSYATEDADIIHAVRSRLGEEHPEHEPWIDLYEIVAGDSLIDKIAEGMDAAEKFFIFLSPVSVGKPWVKRELKRAIMREIQGVDPDYIVPVKVGDLTAIPPFLEEKLYIDLGKMTDVEWLAAFDAAITGMPPRPVGAGSPNVVWWVESGPEGEHVAYVYFAAKAWAERFSFLVETNEDMVEETGSVTDVWPGGSLMGPINLERGPRVAALSFASPDLRPGEPLAIKIEFPPGIDAKQAVSSVSRWSIG